MGFNRIEAKVAAKTSMRLTRPSTMLVTLVYVLLTIALALTLVSLVYNPVTDYLIHVGYLHYGEEEALKYIWETHFSGVVIFLSLLSLLSVYISVMKVGYTSYGLRLARSEQPSYINLFDGFAKLGRVLWMNILIWLFTLLWSVLCWLPAALLSFFVALFEVPGSANVFGSVYMLLVAGGTVVRLAITYRYRLSAYFLIDDPTCTGREAIRRSKEAMRGWKMELFTLDISFIGWYYLSLLTAGILMIWVAPYREATEANFYDCVTATPPSTGSYVGPGYEYRDPDDIQNF